MTGGVMLKDYERGQFERVHTAGEIDLLMNKQASEIFVIWPWWAEAEQIREAMNHAHGMGFTDIIETGNYGTHTADAVDCDDWDYALMVAK